MIKKQAPLLILSVVLLSLYLGNYYLQANPPSLVSNIQDKLSLNPLLPIEKATNLPNMSSQNYILIEKDTNQILIEKNINSPIYPASTTKLATALTALNVYELSKPIEINSAYKEGKIVGLVLKDQYTVQSLLKALLIYSANDAAVALANAYPGGYNTFVSSMNSLVKQYGLKNTNFVSVDGTDNPAHVSTVYDLSQLGRVASNLKAITQIAATQGDTISSIDGKHVFNLVATNELLGNEPEVIGLKTGWTPTAGEAFVGLISYKNHLFISVVADSRDRFGDTKNMLNWLKSQNFDN